MRKVMMTMMVLLLAVTVATAQRGHSNRGNNQFAELNLSAEQQEQIKAIRQASRAQMKEMHKQNPEQRPDREAMKKMRDASQTKIDAVLTAEQREQLAAIKAAHKAEWKAVDREGMKAALKEHNETKVKPVISAARAQLNQFISAEDQASLDRLRPVFANKPKGKQGKGKGRKGKGKGNKPSEADRAAKKAAMDTWKTDHAAEITELKALTIKYAADLKRIQERMKPQREQWGKEKREIMRTYLPEGASKARGHKAGKGKGQKGGDRQKEGRDWPRGAAFLLMKG